MRRFYRLLLISVCLSIVSVVPAFALKLNAPAPDFTLKDIQGAPQTLSHYRGKVVLLNFWATTCPPCVAEIPSLVRLYDTFKGQGLVVLGIALDPAVTPVREAVARLRMDYPTLLDGNREVYFDSYGLFGQPVSVIIDRSGVVRDRIIGGANWTSPQMENRLQSYLKGR